MEKLLKSVSEVKKQEGKLNTACVKALQEILKYIEFEPHDENNEYFGFVVETSTDGVVLCDTFAKVYNISGVLDYIKNNGKIRSYKELQQFSI